MKKAGQAKCPLAVSSVLSNLSKPAPWDQMKHIKKVKDLSEGFEPQMLIEDARVTAPEFSWLPAALANCGAGYWESRAYVRYVSSVAPNQPNSEWQFRTSVTIYHRVLGMVVIDILRDDRIGGIEFVDRID